MGLHSHSSLNEHSLSHKILKIVVTRCIMLCVNILRFSFFVLGRRIGVVKSVDNCRLFVGGIPKDKNAEEIRREMDKLTDGVVDVIVYPPQTKETSNRGYAFIEFECHK